MRKCENGGMVGCGSVRNLSFSHFHNFALPYFHNPTFLKGSVLMETVIVMPIILLLIFMIIQFAHVWIARQMVVYAAYCGARSMMTVLPDEQAPAADRAAKLALSWICLADLGSAEKSGGVSVPGWGLVGGSRSVDRRVKTQVLANGVSQDCVACRVTFSFPLLIPAFGVNAILGNAVNGDADGNRPGLGTSSDFYGELARVTANPKGLDENDPWPYVTFTEVCALPMPYNPRNLPLGGYGDYNFTDYYVPDKKPFEWHSSAWHGQTDFEVNGL